MPKQGRHRVLHHVPSAKRQASMATPDKPWDPAQDPLGVVSLQPNASPAAAEAKGADILPPIPAETGSDVRFSKDERRRLKKERFLQTTAKPKPVEKKAPAPMGSFASLLETIAEVDTVPKEVRVARVATREQRARVTKKELEQLRKVTAHASFQKNPLDIIKQHLTNTIEQQQKDEYKRLREIKLKKKNEKQKNKPAAATDSSAMQT